MNRIDGEPIVFVWKNFPGFTTSGIPTEIEKIMSQLKCEPEQFPGTIIFMAMYNDIIWRTPGNENNCVAF